MRAPVVGTPEAQERPRLKVPRASPSVRPATAMVLDLIERLPMRTSLERRTVDALDRRWSQPRPPSARCRVFRIGTTISAGALPLRSVESHRDGGEDSGARPLA